MTNDENAEFADIPRDLPGDAVEEVTEHWENGNKRNAFYRIDGKVIWSRSFNEAGLLDGERGLSGDTLHGPYRYWADGKLYEEAFYYHGKEHGITRQYGADGSVINTYTMHHGTGIDRWYQELPGEGRYLSEERQYLNGDKHGFERWYFGPSENGYTVYEENHFKRFENHGIFRQWNDRGRLRRGFPQYFVDGVKVTKRRYLTACKRDVTLPPYREEDDDFYRAPLTR